jgi:hypothetical protein
VADRRVLARTRDGLLLGALSGLLRINGRYTSYSGQLYTEATYNVAFADALEPGVFLDSAEVAVLDMRADLF